MRRLYPVLSSKMASRMSSRISCSLSHISDRVIQPSPRLFHVASHAHTPNNSTEASPPKSPAERDQFSYMMNDRTNALLQSLGVDATQFDEQISNQNGDEKPHSVPLVAAVDVNSKPIKMTTPRQHFFDTQDVYSELRSAGLTPGQSEVIMRTMQDLITELVVLCQNNAVPISAAANEAYLFDAASSEVRNEIANSRQAQATTYRAGLARLQRDVEILEHEATEMTSLLKSDLDIEVHERKNSARAEENTIQLKIQELNNKITTKLNSDLKSDIENLRWQITRRSLAAIALIAALFIWLTQTNTRTKTAKTQQRQRQSSGMSVPVPVLAPSMASTDETYEHGSTIVQVEDLSSYNKKGDNLDDGGASTKEPHNKQEITPSIAGLETPSSGSTPGKVQSSSISGENNEQ